MFPDVYNEMLEIAQKHVNAGVPLQVIYGAMSAAMQRIEFILNSQYEQKKILSEWERTLADHPNPVAVPVVNTTEDN